MNTANIPAEAQLLELAETFLTALKNNDWNTMQTILAPDAGWTLPGTSVLSGPAQGAEAIIRRAKGLKAFGVNFQLKHILIGLQGFTLSLHNTAQREQLLLDEQVAIVFGVHEGQIVSMATYLSDVAGINQFFIPGIID